MKLPQSLKVLEMMQMQAGLMERKALLDPLAQLGHKVNGGYGAKREILALKALPVRLVLLALKALSVKPAPSARKGHKARKGPKVRKAPPLCGRRSSSPLPPAVL